MKSLEFSERILYPTEPEVYLDQFFKFKKSFIILLNGKLTHFERQLSQIFHFSNFNRLASLNVDFKGLHSWLGIFRSKGNIAIHE